MKRINASPLNISKINIKEIYRFLVEEITMDEDKTTGSMTLHPLRVELAYPENDWEKTWMLARQILPTSERVARILPNQSPNFTRCRSTPPAVETFEHAMFECRENHKAGSTLLLGLRKL